MLCLLSNSTCSISGLETRLLNKIKICFTWSILNFFLKNTAWAGEVWICYLSVCFLFQKKRKEKTPEWIKFLKTMFTGFSMHLLCGHQTWYSRSQLMEFKIQAFCSMNVVEEKGRDVVIKTVYETFMGSGSLEMVSMTLLLLRTLTLVLRWGKLAYRCCLILILLIG